MNRNLLGQEESGKIAILQNGNANVSEIIFYFNTIGSTTMRTVIIRSDTQILKDVEHELEFDPSLNATEIDVSVKKGIVTLNGTVPHFVEMSNAERATQRVRGVRAISNEMTVNLSGIVSDDAISKAALSLLDWNYLGDITKRCG